MALYPRSHCLQKFRKSLFSLCAFTLLLLASSCEEVSKTKEIKLAHSLEVSHPVHQAMLYMAEKLKEKSGGELARKIYPNSQ